MNNASWDYDDTDAPGVTRCDGDCGTVFGAEHENGGRAFRAIGDAANSRFCRKCDPGPAMPEAEARAA